MIAYPKAHHKTSYLIWVLGAALLLFACSAADYGALRNDPETTRLFKKGEILADHTYFYYGWKGQPDAVVAIRNDYRLASDLWKTFDPADGALDALIARMTTRDMTRFNGAGLYDSDGNRLGAWWSDAPGATVKMSAEEKKVIAFIRPWPLVPLGDDSDPRPS
jgi:hypothetical protein